MKLLLSWLKEYLDFSLSPEELANALTLAGLEAEGIEKVDGEIILEIGLTPNLGHCMSIIGIARELSAILQIPIKRKEVSFQETADVTKNHISIDIQDKDRCFQYSCRLIKDLSIGPSPDWLKKKLTLSGLRSVNNVVDISNLVMLECGQPLHMFDYNKIEGKSIIVKSAEKLGVIETLDEQKRAIPKEVLLICDQKKPLAFAGVMGDLYSSVSEKTKNVLIEAAHFSPEAVRQTSKQLNLRTDSSLRFERGIDPVMTSTALDFCVELLESIAGGKICRGVVFVATRPFQARILELNPLRTNKILGTQLSLREIITFLSRLEIEVIHESEHALKVRIPSYRNDLTKEIDLIEEVGRMLGFHQIPRKLPKHTASTLTHSPLFLIEEKARSKFIAQGLQECLTCDLISPELANLSLENSLGADKQIKVLHPASIDQSILRTSLLPGLLEMIRFNLDRQNQTIAAFEVGHIHFKNEKQFLDEPAAGIILTGQASPYHFEKKSIDVDFLHLKGHVENFLDAMGFKSVLFEPSHLLNFHPGRQAHIKIKDMYVGALGEIHPKHLRQLSIQQRVYYAELNLFDLLKLTSNLEKVSDISPFPSSERDWTLTLENTIPVGAILEFVQSISSSLLEKTFLLDLYQSEKLGKEKKNVTFRFQYRDKNKTIEYEEVEKEHKRITQTIAQKFVNSVG